MIWNPRNSGQNGKFCPSWGDLTWLQPSPNQRIFVFLICPKNRTQTVDICPGPVLGSSQHLRWQVHVVPGLRLWVPRKRCVARLPEVRQLHVVLVVEQLQQIKGAYEREIRFSNSLFMEQNAIVWTSLVSAHTFWKQAWVIHRAFEEPSKFFYTGFCGCAPVVPLCRRIPKMVGLRKYALGVNSLECESVSGVDGSLPWLCPGRAPCGPAPSGGGAPGRWRPAPGSSGTAPAACSSPWIVWAGPWRKQEKFSQHRGFQTGLSQNPTLFTKGPETSYDPKKCTIWTKSAQSRESAGRNQIRILRERL